MTTPNSPDKKLIPSKKYKGVFWNPEEDHWEVILAIPEMVTECGSFLSEEEAAHAYDKCAVEVIPGTPELNFPEE